MNKLDMIGITVTIPDGGHFEKGRWVTIFTPFIDAFSDKMDIDDQVFEMKHIVEIPIFKQGVCTGYRTEERLFGTITQRQIIEMLKKPVKMPLSFPPDGISLLREQFQKLQREGLL